MPELLIAVGVAAGLPHDLVLDLGPFHPSGQGAWQLAVEMNDKERITSVEPRLGLVHRSDEKLFASRDYRQLLMLAGRHAWFTSLHGELVAVLAMESAMGITPTAHSTWSRMLLAELDRVQASLLLCDTTEARGWREQALDLMEIGTGNRVHPMAMRIGGLGQALPDQFLDGLAGFIGALPLGQLQGRVRESVSVHAGLGTLTNEAARILGATGNVGRASGIDLDVRVTMPYLAYADVKPNLTTFENGDVPARSDALLAALADSVRLITVCLSRIQPHRDEPVNITLPKTIKVPVGTTFASVESPLGMLTAMLIADGDRVPLRLALRTPSFANVQAMAVACEGASLDELDPIIRSFMIAIGEVER